LKLKIKLKMATRKKKNSIKIIQCSEPNCDQDVSRQCQGHNNVCERCLHDFYARFEVSGTPDFRCIPANLGSNWTLLKDLEWVLGKLEMKQNMEKLREELKDFMDRQVKLEKEYEELEEDFESLVKFEQDMRGFRAQVEASLLYTSIMDWLEQVGVREVLLQYEEDDTILGSKVKSIPTSVDYEEGTEKSSELKEE
jgi:hypothetical protein